jgi:hypothetical protein
MTVKVGSFTSASFDDRLERWPAVVGSGIAWLNEFSRDVRAARVLDLGVDVPRRGPLRHLALSVLFDQRPRANRFPSPSHWRYCPAR